MNAAAQLAVLLGTVAATASLTYVVKGPPQRTFVCDPASLKEDEICLQQIPANDDVLWIDARTRAEWERDGLQGSMLWSLQEGEDQNAFEAEAMTRMQSVARIVVYCSTEQCGLSRQVAQKINALGMGTKVSVLRGGWKALHDAGRIKDSNRAS